MSKSDHLYVAMRCCCIAFVSACGAFLPSLDAQTAPTPAKRVPTPAQLAKFDLNKNGVLDSEELAALEAEEKTAPVVLTPFEVNTDKDRGYAAGNTLSGGRVNTPLAITPASISVMTKEFLEDFAILDINGAAPFAINMDTANENNLLPFGGNRNEFNFRGSGGAGNYPVRDGIQQFFVADSYNSERFEFSRGPNTAMFGIGGPGGMQGSTSKQTRFNTREVSSSVRVDSFGTYRGTFDYNQGYDRFGVRVNALHQNVADWQKDTSSKQNAITVQAKFKLSPRTILTAQYEKSSEWNRQYTKTYSENASLWDRKTVNENNSQIAGTLSGFGIGFLAGNATTDRLIYNTSTGTLLNYRGFQYQTVGLGYRIPWEGRPQFTNFKPGIGKTFNLGPIDNIADRDNNTREIRLEHAFTPNLTAVVLWNGSDVDSIVPFIQNPPGDYRIDVNRLLPNGAPNPNFGKAYADSTQNSQAQQNEGDDWTANVNYLFRVPRWWDMKQQLNFYGGYRVGRFEAWTRFLKWMNNPNQPNPLNDANSLRIRYYYDNPMASIQPIVTPQALMRLDPTKQWANVDTGFFAYNRNLTTYGQIASQTSFFDERFTLTLTVRRDRVSADNLTNIGNDPNNGYRAIMGNLNPETGLNEAGFHQKATTHRTSKSAGVVAYPFPDRWKWTRPLGFVVNFSENFQAIPTGNPLVSGERPDTPFSKTLDYGLRYSIPGGVAYATLTRYNTDQVGQLGNFGSTGDISNIWLNLGYTDPAFTEFGPFRDTSDRKLEGWEFEITANPTRNITFTANYAHPTVRTVADSVDRRKYVAAHLAEWKAGAAAAPGQVINGRAILDPEVIKRSLQNIEDSFNGSTAGTIGNGARHRASIAGSYRFTEGRIRGMGVNLGVVYRSHSKVGSRDAQLKFGTASPTIQQTTEAAWDYLWTPPTWSTTAGVNYTRRFGKVLTRFQLNVSNLLNEDDPQWNSYSVIAAGQLTPALAVGDPNRNPRMQVLSGFTNPEPRKFIFTTTVTF
jgi:outer membrane receptor protein involved in Fe transport